jgi:hypothetical protein
LSLLKRIEPLAKVPLKRIEPLAKVPGSARVMPGSGLGYLYLAQVWDDEL